MYGTKNGRQAKRQIVSSLIGPLSLLFKTIVDFGLNPVWKMQILPPAVAKLCIIALASSAENQTYRYSELQARNEKRGSAVLNKIKNYFQNLSLYRRFMIASLVILFAGMLGIGAWVEGQIAT